LRRYDHQYVLNTDSTVIDSSASQSKDRYTLITEITVDKSSSEIFTDDQRYDELLNKNDESENEKDEIDENDNDH
jgi:hypothetical protein